MLNSMKFLEKALSKPAAAVRTAGKALLAAALGLVFVGLSPVPASAYTTDGLFLYLNASRTDSYPGTGTTWTDVSGNGRDGTLVGSSWGFDATTESLTFPGGANATNYVELSGDFADFSTGMTIDFEGSFGSVLSNWERVFDFGVNGGGQETFFVSHYYATNQLAIVLWSNNVHLGTCSTAVDGGALTSDDSFAKWTITLDGTKCHIYKDGVELPTTTKDAVGADMGPAVADGSAFAYLPQVTPRPNNYVARSNWVADADFEGSMRYLRMYTIALDASQVADNAEPDDTVPDSNSGSEGAPADENALAMTGVAKWSTLVLATILSILGGSVLWASRFEADRRAFAADARKLSNLLSQWPHKRG
jgi:hypothetical protein